MLNKMNFNEILDKFDIFHNGMNVIKTIILNEKKFSFILNSNIIFKKFIWKLNEEIPKKGRKGVILHNHPIVFTHKNLKQNETIKFFLTLPF